jgi:hypothetical protein
MGGGSQTTKQERNIPDQTPLEAQIQQLLGNFGITGLTNANNFQGQANNAVGTTYNPNWNNLSAKYNNTMSGVTSGYNDLASGVLPSQYATNRQQALNTDLNATVGNTLNNLGQKGIINSSVTRSALNDISKNASDTLARNYSSDLSTQANVLGQQASNATNVLAGNTAAQQGSYYQPSQLFNYANTNYAPASDLFKTMYSGRMGTGSVTSTTTGGDNGVAQAVGGIGSALITACFAAETKILVPDGEKNIEDIKIGDEVISHTGKVERVTFIPEPRECVILEVTTDKGTVKTTPTQRFYTPDGLEYVLDMEIVLTDDDPAKVISIKRLTSELVYDFSTTGPNSFYANGFVAEGWD